MRTDWVGSSAPVADDGALEVPCAEKNVLKKRGVIGAEGPVHTVIGCHHSPWLTLLDRNFEWP